MSLFLYPLVFLVAFGAFALAGLLWYLGDRRKAKISALLFKPAVLKEITKDYSPWLKKFKDITFVLGLFFIFVALARPQWGVERVQADSQASYIVIAVDVSTSMRATDIQPNRLENAKTMLKILVDSLPDVRMGIVAFTSEAYTQCPVTQDVDALNFFINALKPDMLKAKGTSLGRAVTRSVEMLQKYPGKKALVLLTDGEDHVPDEIANSALFAKENNVKIISVGIGSKEGELIPEKIESGKVVEYKKDRDGKTVVSKLNEKPLLELASETGGTYIKYKNFQSVAETVHNAILDLDKQTRALTARQGYKDRYQIPLAIAAICLLMSLFTPLKKVEFRKRK